LAACSICAVPGLSTDIGAQGKHDGILKRLFSPIVLGLKQVAGYMAQLEPDLPGWGGPAGDTPVGVPSELPTHSKPAVFICYSRHDRDFVDRLTADLKRQGVNTWRDVDDIPGQLQANLQGWRAAVQDALETCEAMLVVLTPDALSSSEVQAEWNDFASRRRPIFPVVVRECTVPFYLKIYQIWDLSSDYKRQLAMLAAALRRATEGKPVPAATPTPAVARRRCLVEGGSGQNRSGTVRPGPGGDRCRHMASDRGGQDWRCAGRPGPRCVPRCPSHRWANATEEAETGLDRSGGRALAGRGGRRCLPLCR
jgi:hypothetical protein